MATIPETYRDLFTKKAFAHLATVGANNAPQVTPVWCDWDGTYVRINTARGRVKEKNLRKNPKVALSIQDLDVPVRIVRVLDRERHLRILPEVLFLHPAARRVDPHVGAVPVAPDRCDLGRVVGPDGRQVGKCLLREEVAVGLRNRRHRHSPCVALSCSSTEDSAVSSSTSDVTRVSSSAPPPAPRPWRGAPGACAPRTAGRAVRPA